MLSMILDEIPWIWVIQVAAGVLMYCGALGRPLLRVLGQPRRFPGLYAAFGEWRGWLRRNADHQPG
jgi:hypothetical protein